MVAPTRPPANGFVRVMRKVYNPIGFSKGYNFILFFIFAGALFGFSLARMEYLSFHGVFCPTVSQAGGSGAAPGECYYYTRDFYKVGMILHLATIIPAAFLAVFQFVPVIRHKLIIFHRLNGYLLLVLVAGSTTGALMIARHAFGGTLATQMWVGAMAIMSTLALVMAYINIKLLQIDQHRNWMLRAWFWMACIITLRIIMIISAQIISAQGNYFQARPCAQIEYIYRASPNPQRVVLAKYPGCAPWANGSNPEQQVLVNANFGANPEQLTTALAVPFGAAGWLAWAIHAIGVELYIRLTPKETERLKQVSYKRQLERGFKNPGCAGITVERFGDAEPWVPSESLVEETKNEMAERTTAKVGDAERI